MGRRIKSVFCILLAAAALSGGLPQAAFADSQQINEQEMYGIQAGAGRAAEENGITVTTSDQFLQALKDHKIGRAHV